jgi:hypothetical protein
VEWEIMELDISSKQIKLNKDLNELDNLVIDFTRILSKNKIKYVLVSGYVSILFGRSRSSEDIDLVVKKISKKKFSTLWKALSKENFECLTTDSPTNAYENYLMKRTVVRFSKKGLFIPNMEFKFPKMDLDRWAIENAKKVVLNGNAIMISSIELQIPYKLFLGSEKDIEDARYLYKLFEGWA